MNQSIPQVNLGQINQGDFWDGFRIEDPEENGYFLPFTGKMTIRKGKENGPVVKTIDGLITLDGNRITFPGYKVTEVPSDYVFDVVLTTISSGAEYTLLEGKLKVNYRITEQTTTP